MGCNKIFKLNTEFIVETAVSCVFLFVFASSVRVVKSLAIAVALFVLLILALLCGMRVKLNFTIFLWTVSAIYMLVWTKRLEISVLTYDLFYLLMVLLLIVLQSFPSNDHSERLLKMLWGFAFVAVFVVCLEFLFKEKMLSVIRLLINPSDYQNELEALQTGDRTRSGITNESVVEYGAHILLLSAFYFSNRRKRTSQVFSVLAAIMALYTFAMLGGRSTIVFLIISIIITYTIEHKAYKVMLKSLLLLLVLALVFFVFYKYRLLATRYSAIERIYSTVDTAIQGDDISNGRAVLYTQAIDLWKKNPVFGIGWQEFYFQNTGILKADKNSYVHNFLLEMLCECGVVGTILLLSPMLYVYILNIKAIKRNGKLGNVDLHRFTLTFQTNLLLDSFLHVGFYNRCVMILYFAVIGIFLRENRNVINYGQYQFKKKHI